mmetsp:Transcript_15211/g.38177  ORF Transcript_15211/g.38177 Transcript_15211/m.38177 type:complete len:314 (+) Transcript_15211:59-1000(+)
MGGKNIFSFLGLLTGLTENKICQNCLFFVGSMPKNFSRSKLNYLKLKDYLILEKSDGVRYLILLGKKKSFFLDRNLGLHKIPNKKNQKIVKKVGTILDGEMSFNIIKEEYEYLIYDIICFEGDWRISTWDLNGRIALINQIQKKNPLYGNWIKKNLKKKDFFTKINIKKIFQKIQTNFFSNDHIFLNQNRMENLLCNKNDGLIFTLSKSIYFTKHPNFAFKWKYEEENSVDFSTNFEKIAISNKKIFLSKENLFCKNFKKNFLNVFQKKKIVYTSNPKSKKEGFSTQMIEEYIFNPKKRKMVFFQKKTRQKQP